MSKVVLVVVAVVVNVVMFLRVYTPEGTVMVPGYEHAIAICEHADSTVDHERVTQVGKYHMWTEGSVVYTVDYGHLNDPEVAELKKWAVHECAQYQQ